MNTLQVARLLLVFAHLLLCAFALQRLLVTDWRVLRARLGPDELAATHRVMVVLLAGLWASGVALATIDLGSDAARLAAEPKLACKLLVVGTLTANSVLLRAYCFPRVQAQRPLGAVEAAIVCVSGAWSTTSWLIAAFLGVARPLKDWPLPQLLVGYALALAAATAVAVLMALLRPPLPGRRGAAEPAANVGTPSLVPAP